MYRGKIVTCFLKNPINTTSNRAVGSVGTGMGGQILYALGTFCNINCLKLILYFNVKQAFIAKLVKYANECIFSGLCDQL